MPSILIAGATGLVGQHCLRRVLATPAFERVVVLTRRPLPPSAIDPAGSGRVETHVVDFEQLDAHAALFDVDQILCALGTTIKQAGSQARFRRVDHDYVLALARLGVARGAHHFLLVSALGADPGSRIFYNRVKGEVEEALRTLQYRTVSVVRPSLLLGQRRELRLGERLGALIGRFVPGRYRPVEADAVAAVLVQLALADAPGWCVVESEEIRHRAAALGAGA